MRYYFCEEAVFDLEFLRSYFFLWLRSTVVLLEVLWHATFLISLSSTSFVPLLVLFSCFGTGLICIVYCSYVPLSFIYRAPLHCKGLIRTLICCSHDPNIWTWCLDSSDWPESRVSASLYLFSPKLGHCSAEKGDVYFGVCSFCLIRIFDNFFDSGTLNVFLEAVEFIWSSDFRIGSDDCSCEADVIVDVWLCELWLEATDCVLGIDSCSTDFSLG